MSAIEPMEQAPALSVVAPAFNEQESIEDFVVEMCQHLDTLAAPGGSSVAANALVANAALANAAVAERETYEVICVDDGSSDQTFARLLELQQRFPRLRPVALDRNHGQSAALAAGVSVARGEIIALIDSDLQNDPADVGRLFALLQSNTDVDCYVGVRAKRRDTWLRRVSSKIANSIGRWITGEHIKDAACGLKVSRATLLKRVTFFRGAHRFLATLVRLEGGTVHEIDVNHRPRAKGESKYGSGLGRTFIALRDAFGVRWLKDRKIRYKLESPGREK
jgi:glycosyltransferase involved in cell wall biosynthesis